MEILHAFTDETLESWSVDVPDFKDHVLLEMELVRKE